MNLLRTKVQTNNLRRGNKLVVEASTEKAVDWWTMADPNPSPVQITDGGSFKEWDLCRMECDCSRPSPGEMMTLKFDTSFHGNGIPGPKLKKTTKMQYQYATNK